MKNKIRIRDVEDGDCYFEGYITEMRNGVIEKYIVEKVVWNGEESLTKEDDDVIGEEIPLRWWYVEILGEEKVRVKKEK